MFKLLEVRLILTRLPSQNEIFFLLILKKIFNHKSKSSIPTMLLEISK